MKYSELKEALGKKLPKHLVPEIRVDLAGGNHTLCNLTGKDNRADEILSIKEEEAKTDMLTIAEFEAFKSKQHEKRAFLVRTRLGIEDISTKNASGYCDESYEIMDTKYERLLTPEEKELCMKNPALLLELGDMDADFYRHFGQGVLTCMDAHNMGDKESLRKFYAKAGDSAEKLAEKKLKAQRVERQIEVRDIISDKLEEIAKEDYERIIKEEGTKEI